MSPARGRRRSGHGGMATCEFPPKTRLFTNFGSDCLDRWRGWGHCIRRYGRAGEMTRGELSGPMLEERRHLLGADRELRDRTARVEHAAAGRIQRRGDVAMKKDALLVLRGVGLRHR